MDNSLDSEPTDFNEDVLIVRPFAGLLYMICCAKNNLSEAEILADCNRKNQCGTSNGWAKVHYKDDENTDIRPVTCADHPDTRTHYVVSC